MIGGMPCISQESPKLYWNIAKKSENASFNRKKNEFSENCKSLQFVMVQGSLKTKMTFLGEKLWQVAWNQNLLVLYEGEIEKMPMKSVKIK